MCLGAFLALQGGDEINEKICLKWLFCRLDGHASLAGVILIAK